MSNYKTHSIFNVCLALPILTGALLYFFHPIRPLVLTFMATFLYSTLFMSPDMDLAHQIKLFSLRGFLTLPFRGYSMVFRHRGLSHSLLFGSATRILWLAGLGFLAFYLVYSTLPSEKIFHWYYKKHAQYIWYAFGGICCADWCHLLLDLKK